MRVPQLKLNNGNNADFTDIPLWTSHLYIPLRGHKAVVRKGEKVAARQLLAAHPDLLVGDVHAPAAGTVEDILGRTIVLAREAQKAEDHLEDLPEGVVFDQMADADLPRALKELGIDLGPLLTPCKTMVINAMSPEPPMSWPALLLDEYDDLLEDGLDLLRRLRPDVEFVLTVEKDKKNKAGVRLDDLETVYIKPYYPNGLDPVVIREVCAQRGLDAAETACLSLQRLYYLGTVAVYGLPLTETIVSAQLRSRVINIGTPVGDIFTDQEVEMGAGDLVILGGPFQGETVPSLRHGVPKDVPGVFMMRFQTFAPYSKDPCVNCGHCVHLCPVGLWPSDISRYIEKKDFAAAETAGVGRCIDCGLCGYICVARRPMLQWMKTAKQRLGLAPDAKFAAWDPETYTVTGTYARKADKRKQNAGQGGSRG